MAEILIAPGEQGAGTDRVLEKNSSKNVGWGEKIAWMEEGSRPGVM